MDRYTYRPPKRTGPAAALAGGCFMLSAALLVSLRMSGSLTGLVVTACASLLLCGVAVTSRFILSSFIYVLDKGVLSVFRIQGSKSVRISAVSLSEVEEIFDRKALRHYEKKQGKIRTRRNYCCNLYVREPYALVLSEDGTSTAVFLEADELFIDQIKIIWKNGLSSY